jgi:hypothetical protein
MPPADRLAELVAQYIALHDQARVAARRKSDAYELMEAADFAHPEPLGILAMRQPGTAEKTFADTGEGIEAIFAPAIAAGGEEAKAWIARRDAALARLAALRVAREIFGIPEAEQAEEAIWKEINRLGTEIRATPAGSVVGIAAKLRALVVNAALLNAPDGDVFDRRLVLDVLADAERLAGESVS